MFHFQARLLNSRRQRSVNVILSNLLKVHVVIHQIPLSLSLFLSLKHIKSMIQKKTTKITFPSRQICRFIQCQLASFRNTAQEELQQSLRERPRLINWAVCEQNLGGIPTPKRTTMASFQSSTTRTRYDNFPSKVLIAGPVF